MSFSEIGLQIPVCIVLNILIRVLGQIPQHLLKFFLNVHRLALDLGDHGPEALGHVHAHIWDFVLGEGYEHWQEEFTKGVWGQDW